MRANTDIEQFILNYGENEPDGISLANDLYLENSEDDDDQEENGVDMEVMNTTTTTTTSNATPTKKRTRLQVISSREDNEFMRLLAGAMDVDLEELYENEDIDDVIQREYDTVNALKRRRMVDEDRNRRIDNIKAHIEELKTKLISAGDQERVDAAFLELDKLRSLVGDADTILYAGLVHKYTDYTIALAPNTESSELITLMERYYTENGENSSDFIRQLENARIDKNDTKALRGIVINALWQRDIGSKSNVEPFIDAIETSEGIDDNTKTEVLLIKQEAVTISNTPVKKEFAAPLLAEAIKLAAPSPQDTDTRVSPKYDSYVRYMAALIGARDDIMMCNELTKGVNITSIHAPALNEKISALTNPSISRIIDTSHAYFRQMYYNSNDAVTQYTDIVKTNLVNKLTLYEENLGQYRTMMERSLRLYEKLLVPVLERTIDIFDATVAGREQSKLLKTQVLARYKRENLVRNGKVKRGDIDSFVINDEADDFFFYYTTRWTDRVGVPPIDNYLAMCDLFLSLAAYISERNLDIKQQIAIENQRLQQLMAEAADSVDIDDDSVSRQNARRMYSTINVKPRVSEKIDEAYNLVTQYCVDLRGLPLAAFKSPAAIKAGLAGDFARYIDALMNDSDTRKPTSYKSRLDHENVVKRKSEMMNRLKAYSYTMRYDGAPMNRYTFYKNTADRNSQGGGARRSLFSVAGRDSFLL